jgi:UPF0755 protein
LLRKNVHNEYGELEKKKRPFWLIPVIIIAIGIVCLLGFLFYASQMVKAPNSTDSTKSVFVITEGQGSGEVAKNLEKENLIKNRFIFVLYLNYKGVGDKVQAGEYEIARNLSMIDVASLVTTGKIVTNKITIPEGWTIEQIGDYLAKNTEVKKEDFLLATKKSYDYAFLADKPKDANLEGYLYPDTYMLSVNPTADEVVKKMLDNFDRKYTEEIRNKAKGSNMSTYEVVTLASIVEREVAKADDRKLVASVFLNRLNYDMPLESCATIQYILKVNKKQFTYEETRTPSPYNTYILKGLPEGPIGNPSIDSISAVLFPEKSNYYYFLSAGGTTYFSKTIEEHNAKKVQYLD